MKMPTSPGPSCPKLTMSLDFLLIKCENPLQCKGFSHFIIKINSVFAYIVSINYVTSRGLNYDVKLTMF